MRIIPLLIIILIVNAPLQAQNTFKALIKDAKTGAAIPDVSVGIKDSNKGGLSDTAGKVIIDGLGGGRYFIAFSVIGYERKVMEVVLPDTATKTVLLVQDENRLNDVIVSSTRNDRPLDDAPMRVEVVNKEEMQEEQATRPANVTGMLGDIGGIQVQQTSVTTGNANLRIQGLNGGYTQLLRDGMPLYDGLSGGFGILQVQPLDLKQIEVVKGPASTLYGGGAIAGLINFISKTPSAEQQAEIIINQTSLTETSATAFLSKKYDKWGYTLFGGYTHQDAVNISNQGFSDVPRLHTINFHPKLFYYPDEKTTISIGYSGTNESRKGGDMKVLSGAADSTHQYYEADKTARNTGELQAVRKFAGNVKATFKASVSGFNERIQTNVHYFNGSQLNYYSEASVLVTKEKYNYVAGIDVTGDNFVKKPSDPTPVNNFSNSTTGIFAQLNNQLPLKTTLQTGIRGDWHNRYGGFVLPAIAIVHHFSNAFFTRAGFGIGYKTPNALEPQLIDYNIQQLLPIGDSVRPEYSYGYNIDLNYKKQWDREKYVYINSTFFLTEITSSIVATELKNNNVIFSNARRPILTRGIDNFVKLQLGELEVYVGYTYTVAQREYLPANQLMPLTPLHHAAFTTAYEIEGKWRFGIESDYAGSQYRDGYPKTPAYFVFAALIEKDFGRHFAILLNGENLGDVRQSRYETLYTGSIRNPEFKPVWAPVDGRVISLSVRARL